MTQLLSRKERRAMVKEHGGQFKPIEKYAGANDERWNVDQQVQARIDAEAARYRK